MSEVSRNRVSFGLGGLLLVAGHFAVDFTSDGRRVVFSGDWDHVAPSEAWHWLSTMFLLLPGAVLLGLALAPQGLALWRALSARLDALTPRDRIAACLALGLLSASGAQLLNAVVLQGLPVTDDEYGALFGGRVWAQGALLAPVPQWIAAAPHLFLFARDGLITSFDFPGVLAAWAFSELTGSGTWIFSLAAGGAVVGLAVAAGRRWGPRAAFAIVVLAVASPHFALQSIASHAHTLSRGFLAGALGVLAFVEAPSARRGFFGALLLGCAGLTRPIETAIIAAPWAIGLVLDAVKDRRNGFALAFVGTATACVALFVAIDLMSSGSPLPLRFVANDVVHPYGHRFLPPFDFSAWPHRFGNNVMYNLTMSGIFLLGPVGLPLAVVGATADATHRRLAAGALGAYALGILHDDRGVHALGPVHVSDASVVMMLFIVAGLVRVARWLEQKEAPIPPAVVAAYALGLTLFTGGYLTSLRTQAQLQAGLYEFVDASAGKQAVILAPPYEYVYPRVDGSQVGTWIHSWRRPQPWVTEDTLVLHDSPEARARVRGWFPDREVLVLEERPDGWDRVPLEQARPPVKRLWAELREGDRSKR